MPIRDICHRDVTTCAPSDSVLHAARLMSSRNVGTVVVVSTKREPVGIVTDRDIALRVVAGKLDPEVTPLSEVMERVLTIASENDGIRYVVQRMRASGVRRVPVVFQGSGALYGIVALDDVLRAIGREMSDIADLIETRTLTEPAERAV